MAGALDSLGVRQVECGLNLTVALTVDGRVWQMGETGAAADKQAPWERARLPVQVGVSSGHRLRRLLSWELWDEDLLSMAACHACLSAAVQWPVYAYLIECLCLPNGDTHKAVLTQSVVADCVCCDGCYSQKMESLEGDRLRFPVTFLQH